MASFVRSDAASGVEIPGVEIEYEAGASAAVPRLFDGLPSSEVGELLKHGIRSRTERQQVVFREGEPIDRLFIVESGSFKRIRQSRDGRELIVALAGSGDFFGALVEPVVATTLVQALQDSVCFSVPAPVVRRTIERHPLFAVRLLGSMQARKREAELAATRFAFENVPQRLVHLILAASDPGSGELRFPLNQTEIASLIGSSRETVCSILNRLRRNGTLALSRGRIRILDRKRLEAIH